MCSSVQKPDTVNLPTAAVSRRSFLSAAALAAIPTSAVGILYDSSGVAAPTVAAPPAVEPASYFASLDDGTVWSLHGTLQEAEEEEHFASSVRTVEEFPFIPQRKARRFFTVTTKWRPEHPKSSYGKEDAPEGMRRYRGEWLPKEQAWDLWHADREAFPMPRHLLDWPECGIVVDGIEWVFEADELFTREAGLAEVARLNEEEIEIHQNGKKDGTLDWSILVERGETPSGRVGYSSLSLSANGMGGEQYNGHLPLRMVRATADEIARFGGEGIEWVDADEQEGGAV